MTTLVIAYAVFAVMAWPALALWLSRSSLYSMRSVTANEAAWLSMPLALAWPLSLAATAVAAFVRWTRPTR